MTPTENKETIRRLNQGFAMDDAELILSRLHDDVRWIIAGFATASGKEEFRQHIHNDAFQGVPVISIKNEIAEGDQVAVEGSVQSKFADGSPFEAFFHNTYTLKDGKVKEMTSYVVPKRLKI